MNKKRNSTRSISIGDKAKPQMHSPKPKVLSGNNIITFGKYKGRLVSELPITYIEWLRENTNWRVDNDLLKYSKPKVDKEDKPDKSKPLHKPLHPDSIHREFGREYEDEIPKYHIEGEECSPRAYEDYIVDGQRKEIKWKRNKVLLQEAGYNSEETT